MPRTKLRQRFHVSYHYTVYATGIVHAHSKTEAIRKTHAGEHHELNTERGNPQAVRVRVSLP